MKQDAAFTSMLLFNDVLGLIIENNCCGDWSAGESAAGPQRVRCAMMVSGLMLKLTPARLYVGGDGAVYIMLVLGWRHR